MSRSDQFIGLTKKGDEFVKEMRKDQTNIFKRIKIGEYCFDPYPIEGIEITTPTKIYRERIQTIPWSSGPMYFCCFDIIDRQTGKKIKSIYKWKEDENVKGEVDYDHGKYWI